MWADAFMYIGSTIQDNSIKIWVLLQVATHVQSCTIVELFQEPKIVDRRVLVSSVKDVFGLSSKWDEAVATSSL
jgi:hypothetical protein